MALPRQVQRTIEEVEELEKQMQAPVNEESKDSDAPKMEVVSEQTADAEEEESTEDQTVVVDEEETPPQSEAPEVSEETWEHKYHRLQGKYDAEVPRLHHQLKELSSQLKELRSSMEEKPKAKVEEPKVEPLVTDADIEEYGEDLVNLARRIAKDTIREDMAAIKAENKQLKELLDQTGSQVGEMGFEAKLHRLVPDFASINNDPSWIEWLDTTDPFLGVPRRTVAQEAFNKGDADAVARFVGLFRGETGAAAEDAVKQSRRSEVARQVQPSKTASSATPVTSKGRTYSRADVDAMFRKVTEYSSKQQHEKAKKLEAEIDAAFREGRVQV